MNLENVRIVLVGPLYGGNVGSVCRAMSNTGLKELAIADPRPLNMLEARMMSCHAEPLLRARQTFDTLAEAVADCGLVIGTSARRGLYRQHAKSPRDWAPTILEASAHSKVGLVFGREDKDSPMKSWHCARISSRFPRPTNPCRSTWPSRS